MASPADRLGRGDPRGRARADLDRFRRREPGGKLWRWLALVGSVGWPIAALAVGGALLGRALDARLHTGIHFTLALLVLGTTAGTIVAFRAVHGGAR